MPIGSSRDIRLTLLTRPGNVYSSMDVEVILPVEDNLPVLNLCSVEVIRIGENIPCLNMDYINKFINYSSRYLYCYITNHFILYIAYQRLLRID